MNRQPSGSPIGGQFAEGRRPSGPDLVTSDETTVMDVKVTVNRKTGEISVTTDGEWSGLGDFDPVWDQLSETAQGVVERTPDEYLKPDAVLISPDQLMGFNEFVAEWRDPDAQLDDVDFHGLEEEALAYLLANPPAEITYNSLRLTVKKWAWEESEERNLVKFSLNSDVVTALDDDKGEVTLSRSDFEGALLKYCDGKYVYLDLMNGDSVRLDPIDIESDYYSD